MLIGLDLASALPVQIFRVSFCTRGACADRTTAAMRCVARLMQACSAFSSMICMETEMWSLCIFSLCQIVIHFSWCQFYFVSVLKSEAAQILIAHYTLFEHWSTVLKPKEEQ